LSASQISIPESKPAGRILSVGDKVDLTITDIAFGGEGVARLEDLVVFIPFVNLGELVEGEIIESKKNFARARLLKVIRPAASRVQPPCPYFGQCGGCQYQHMDYASQLQIKQKQVRDLFQRIGGFSAEVVAPVIPCPQPYGYRNRIMIRSQWDKVKQGLNIGFIRADNRLVVDIEECKIAEQELNSKMLEVRRNPPPKGGLKVVLRINPENWFVPKDSFFQNNFFLLPELVNTVRQSIRSSGVRHLVDVFCGVGFFGIEMAGELDSFAGVELDKLAIESARRNALSRSITNGEFVYGTAEAVLPGLISKFDPKKTAVLLDPPRKGCMPETLELLRSVRPAQVIYVSCHPATMARDMKILCADGLFELKMVTPLDMFPQTAHVESVGDLRNAAARPAPN
jgi:tRNA/tmRNA/rRNA uracil-C5-methylase (TrmA/RlmC/RlmD family)